ncbi:phospholipase D family protein [Knoellia subterranea]|uniref:Phospholipase D n=1 Tax=Knoellia subterranea KCTC 19937 TaxID=1385521 RepID=A0A0A0JPE7_9MICO|nr:phospholipase D-like domain-containing protein [Knoellia subterranea]KGN38629.1 phospholipase D [Knoellia subterranea KCTC 19937]
MKPEVTRWLLSESERDNPDTTIDAHHPGEDAWSAGNVVTPLVDGAEYFAALHRVLEATTEGDTVFLAGWQIDADQLLTDDPQSAILAVLDRAENRKVKVHGLVWRSHTEQLDFAAEKNREVAEELADEDDEHAEVLLDMRVRRGGAHHQKFVVVRHRDDPSRDIAFVGGIDVAHNRRDTSDHHGDPQGERLADAYGPRPGWHDVHCAVTGPAVFDVETVFRERWEDPSPLAPALHSRLRDRLSRVRREASPLPPQAPPPPPVVGGTHVVQILRTYPHLHRPRAYPFARSGERSIARAHMAAIGRAEELIYIEDQYLWSSSITEDLAAALTARPELRVIAVLPHRPDIDGAGALMQLEGRTQALEQLRAAGGDRFAAYGIENHTGWPVYVHAKVFVIDDWYATIGSDNVNRRSWTHDSELAALVVDEAGTDHSPYARALRLRLAAEHLDRPLAGSEHEEAMADCVTPRGAFVAYATAAAALQAWHDAGRVGPRPAGRLRPLDPPAMSSWQRRAFEVPQRLVGDPDGRPRELRRRHEF